MKTDGRTLWADKCVQNRVQNQCPGTLAEKYAHRQKFVCKCRVPINSCAENPCADRNPYLPVRAALIMYLMGTYFAKDWTRCAAKKETFYLLKASAVQVAIYSETFSTVPQPTGSIVDSSLINLFQCRAVPHYFRRQRSSGKLDDKEDIWVLISFFGSVSENRPRRAFVLKVFLCLCMLGRPLSGCGHSTCEGLCTALPLLCLPLCCCTVCVARIFVNSDLHRRWSKFLSCWRLANTMHSYPLILGQAHLDPFLPDLTCPAYISCASALWAIANSTVL